MSIGSRIAINIYVVCALQQLTVQPSCIHACTYPLCLNDKMVGVPVLADRNNLMFEQLFTKYLCH